MRFYPLLIIGLAILAFFNFSQGLNKVTPSREAVKFVRDISHGNLSKIVRNFGGNTCHCPAKGGWGSYLVYPSGQEPNLAFLVGRTFSYSDITVQYLKQERPPSQILPWEKAEDTEVDLHLAFDPAAYSPYFLPLPLAYGKKISLAELRQFATDPQADAWKGFTLRVRPGLKPGSILADERTIGVESKPDFRALEDLFTKGDQHKAGGVERPNVDQKMIKETLGESAAEFLTPTDAGDVIDDNGKIMPYSEVEKLLPRLSSINLRLHVVRNGQLDDWTIFHFVFDHAIVTTDNGKHKFSLVLFPPDRREPKP
jgi:hypothetical protein